MKKSIRITVTAVCVLLLIVGITLAVQPFLGEKTYNLLSDDVVTADGTIYYVNADTDSDKYDGTSEKTPLKTLEQVNALTLEPGDRVLFKKDCAWYGEVIITSSGTKEAPIVYGMYGEGENKPAIHGEGRVHAVISAEDVSHVEVRNLEITNDDDDKIGNTLQFRRGISFVAAYQSLEGIKIRECYVHHVDSNETGPEGTSREFSDEHWYGGIIIRGKSMKNKDDKTITLKDTLIENNVVDHCSLVGIVMGHYSGGEKGTGTVIRGNYVSNCPGDGIILFNDKEGLIEYNVSDSNGERGRTDVASAGIWIIFCDDTVMQYNEAFDTGMSGDGQGFDIDGSCTGTLFQYNYSHNNYGGMLLLMQNFGHDAIVRYNVSVNDGGGLLNIAVAGGEAGQTDFHIDVYNNTYFTTDQIDSVIYFRGDLNRTARIYGHFRNNIFCVRNGTSATFATGDDLNDLRFENNCYYGFLEGTLPEYEDGRIIANPKFAAIGTEGKGLDTLNGYRLLADSPCLGSGMDIYNNGGLDYWGNKINDDLINIGAYAGQATERPESFNAALAQTADISTFNGILMLKQTEIVKLIDGFYDKVISTKLSDVSDEKQWVEIELDDLYELEEVILYPAEGGEGFPKDFIISICDEDGKWQEVVSKKNYRKPKNGKGQSFEFDAVTGDKIRIEVTEMRENADGKYSVQFTEIEAY